MQIRRVNIESYWKCLNEHCVITDCGAAVAAVLMHVAASENVVFRLKQLETACGLSQRDIRSAILAAESRGYIDTDFKEDYGHLHLFRMTVDTSVFGDSYQSAPSEVEKIENAVEVLRMAFKDSAPDVDFYNLELAAILSQKRREQGVVKTLRRLYEILDDRDGRYARSVECSAEKATIDSYQKPPLPSRVMSRLESAMENKLENSRLKFGDIEFIAWLAVRQYLRFKQHMHPHVEVLEERVCDLMTDWDGLDTYAVKSRLKKLQNLGWLSWKSSDDVFYLQALLSDHGMSDGQFEDGSDSFERSNRHSNRNRKRAAKSLEVSNELEQLGKSLDTAISNEGETNGNAISTDGF